MLPVIITEITRIEIFRICQTIEIIRKLIWKKIFVFQEMGKSVSPLYFSSIN